MTMTGTPSSRPGDDAARVAFDGGLREVGDFSVGNDDRLGDRVGHGAQAGAEDDADARGEVAEAGAQVNGGRLDLIVIGKGHWKYFKAGTEGPREKGNKKVRERASQGGAGARVLASSVGTGRRWKRPIGLWLTGDGKVPSRKRALESKLLAQGPIQAR